MASDLTTITHICDQAGLGHRLTFKKMFGEYALYLDGKVVAFVCDNQLYLKPTPEGRALLGTPHEAPPYPGAKLYFRLDTELDDRDQLRQLLEATEAALPMPKPKTKKPQLKANSS